MFILIFFIGSFLFNYMSWIQGGGILPWILPNKSFEHLVYFNRMLKVLLFYLCIVVYIFHDEFYFFSTVNGCE